MNSVRPVICSYTDKDGGAARAAYSHHKALLLEGIYSEMIVALKRSDLESVHGPVGKFEKGMAHLRREFAQFLVRFHKKGTKNLHSIQILPSKINRKLSLSNCNVVNLHWICSEFISIEDIGKIKKPLVWTLHDMWPILGTEHYVSDVDFQRSINGYKNNSEQAINWIDLNRWCWNRKKKAWKLPFQIVVSSQWMKDKVEKTDLMKGWPITVIPNVIDLDRFRPMNKKYAREILGIPLHKHLIAFGATNGLNDQRKGGDLLLFALRKVNKVIDNLDVLIFGQSKPNNLSIELNNKIHWIGPVNDDIVLSLIYNAADVIAIPSRQDNLPLTAAEAQSCGCPVVAFDATGLPDLVHHKVTGYLAIPFSVEDLSTGIIWLLEDKDRLKKISNSARLRAESLWSAKKITSQYLEVYKKAINQYELKS
jgi:glycosyltransferase involved in cell wall biosynthesis